MNNEQMQNSVWTVRHVVGNEELSDAEHDTLTIVGAANLRAVCAALVEPTIKFVGYLA